MNPSNISMKNAIILLSGGLDSSVTAYYVRKKLKYDNIKAIFFDYNQKSLKEEEYCAREISKKINAEFIKVDLNWLGSISTSFINKSTNKGGDFPETTEEDLESKKDEDITNWYVPCRNSIFLLNALAYAESEFLSKKERYDLFIGLKNEGNVHMKDTTPKFIEKFNELAEEATNDGGYKILAPLIKYDKPDVIKLGQELEVPFELTYSCYVGNNFKDNKLMHCGKCLTCMERKKSFYWCNIKDKSNYLS